MIRTQRGVVHQEPYAATSDVILLAVFPEERDVNGAIGHERCGACKQIVSAQQVRAGCCLVSVIYDVQQVWGLDYVCRWVFSTTLFCAAISRCLVATSFDIAHSHAPFIKYISQGQRPGTVGTLTT